MKKVALVTYAECPQLTDDDRLLIPALARLGVEAIPCIWDAAIEWRQFDRLVIRSTWDYHLRPSEFLAWVETVHDKLSNSATLIRWNLCKSYLKQLADANIRVAPTIWVDEGQEVDVHAIMAANGWSSAIVKPPVSASAHGLRRVFASEPRLRLAGPLMIQPFLSEVVTHGEWSLIFFAGEFSHAVIKTSSAGEFRVQWQYGGSAKLTQPAAAIIHSAGKVLEQLPEVPLCARVDGVEQNGEFVLMELELIEPELFLRLGGAADRFAAAISGSL